jgi:hypothetical protein
LVTHDGKSSYAIKLILGVKMKNGLYANINAKQERVKAGSGEKMRKPGTKGAPTKDDFKQSAKTAKPLKK